jgi:hypothetical protein
MVVYCDTVCVVLNISIMNHHSIALNTIIFITLGMLDWTDKNARNCHLFLY